MAISLKFKADGFREFGLLLDRFSENVTDAKPAFEAMADVHRDSMAAQFAAQGKHTGPRWAALSPRYAAWKARKYPGKPIMELTGALKQAMTVRPFGVDVVTGTGFTLGTDISYARYHQKGTPFMPQRRLIGRPTQIEQARHAKILQGWIIDRNVRV